MIVGISGKMQSGKDTVALMWQYIDDSVRVGYPISIANFKDWYKYNHNLKSKYIVKYFAGKLREFVSSITGLSIKQLMDDKVKSIILPGFNKTPRQLLQLIGTEVCRMVDPDFHIIALMNDYKDWESFNPTFPGEEDLCDTMHVKKGYPDWIIPDTRFPNEVKAILDREGIVIRVERSWEHKCPSLWEDYIEYSKTYAGPFLTWLLLENDTFYRKYSHPSETSLDDYPFNIIIYNNGTLEELLDKVKNTYHLLNNKKNGDNSI